MLPEPDHIDLARRKMILIFCAGLYIFFLICGFSGCTGNKTDNSVVLTWNTPLTNTDGSSLTDLAGYQLYFGTSSHNYTKLIKIPLGDERLSCIENTAGNVGSKNQKKCTYTVSALPAGKYYFVMTAYNVFGKESAFSNEVEKLAIPSVK